MMWHVCDDVTCVWWCDMCVMMWHVWWCDMRAMMWHVCDDVTCVWRCDMCVMTWHVCDDVACEQVYQETGILNLTKLSNLNQTKLTIRSTKRQASSCGALRTQFSSRGLAPGEASFFSFFTTRKENIVASLNSHQNKSFFRKISSFSPKNMLLIFFFFCKNEAHQGRLGFLKSPLFSQKSSF